jgi:CheY-like chemotaxis protein/nitrogen-specific signal transduction histidine kinase
VAERTHELERTNRRLQEEIRVRRETEEALREARDTAEEASQAKSRFLANMSHEMRTPLNGVLGLAELLQKDDLPPEARHRIDMLRRSADSLLSLIEQILDFSKIEADRLTVEIDDFHLPELEEFLTEVLGRRAEAKGLEFRLQRDPDIPDRLRGDGVRLRQILINLVDNAIKFTKEGGVEVRFRLDRREDDALWLDFVVRDTGIGIERETARHLFQPFTQGDESTSRRFGGTGLGLAICRSLAELMGGSIRLESTPGEGSTFTVHLPFQRAAAPVEVPAADDCAESRDLGALAVGRKVLVAEDSEVNQIVLSLQLKGLGLANRVVADGAEVFAALEEENFDLILMDCQMPGVDGYEATRRLRAGESEGRHLPIIAVTASAVKAELDRCRQVGMDDVLSKPYREEELREVLCRWLPQPREQS